MKRSEKNLLADTTSDFNFQFGDKRIDRRAQHMVERMPTKMGQSLPQIFTSEAELMAAYRYFDSNLVTPENILTPHVAQTIERCKAQKVVATIQDTTDLTYDYLQGLEGYGKTHPRVKKGLRLHVLMAISEKGTPLGILNSHHFTRVDGEEKKGRNARPIEKKESFRWLVSYRKSCDLARQAPETLVVCLSDREGDIYECLAEAEGAALGQKAHIITRAQHNRPIDEEGDDCSLLLRDELAQSPVIYQADLNLSKREKDNQSVTVEVRSVAAKLRGPIRKRTRQPSFSINAVLVSEVDFDGESTIDWLLLTTLPIATTEEVQRVVSLYCSRWQIEVYFKVLKSGCQVESLRLQTTPRIENYLALSLVVAWKVMLATYLPREYPTASFNLLFTEKEWKLAYFYVYGKGKPLPKKPPNLKGACTLIAQLGGYIKRKDPPVIQTVWRGIARLMDILYGFELALEVHREELLV